MGAIDKVSGPLVVASDMLGSNMYDVVRVGKDKLIGEIIQLKGDNAIIQVYEDTSGVRPGEPVETTGKPLSVELGPGLLSNIYDGIQRPLEEVRQKSGAFIGRGIVASPLDRKKKWKFVLEKGIKKGSKVKQTEVLGHVQETGLIKHFIMVPLGVEGTIESIKEGNFTIDDVIGKIKSGNKIIEIKMAQTRPVRKAAPFKRKTVPDAPLVTGQRVIDTLFPVAKGGTAAVPGPFGAGKCVSGDTPIVLSDGRIMSISSIYDSKYLLESSDIRQEGNEELMHIAPIGLVSFKGNRLGNSKSDTLYRGKSDSLIRVKTRTGKTVRVTPIHKLFRITERGSIVETMAKDLKAGEFIASARKLDINNEDSTIRIPEWVSRVHTTGKAIILPDKVTPEFAEFMGYFVSEGYIRGKGTVVFTNSEEPLLDRFMELAKKLFDITGKKDYQPGKTPNVLLMSRNLVRFMRFMVTGDVACRKGIPQCILASSNESVAAFLTSYFIGDGSYSDGEIEFCTASARLQMQLSYVLSRFGIISVLKERIINGETYYRVFVRGRSNLANLAGIMPSAHRKIASIRDYVAQGKREYDSIDVVPLSKECLKDLYSRYGSYSELLKDGIEIHNYIGNGERMGAETFKKFTRYINVRSGGMMQKLAIHELAESLEWIYCDEIISVQEEQGPFDVYDVSLPEYGSNFVGGHGGLILHNTVIQQQLAKWSDADIVVYVGCGERGNEMTDILVEFPELKDPKSGRPLMERTILVANTSNMPVAAREASVYTGITLAEYFRDMGYAVAIMADSTSRWAEAMREMSARLEEMPGEEAYPAYLPKRLAEYYERGGVVESLNGRMGSITIIGAVSPQGGDISEPVSQGTLRVVKTFWALDASLAGARHFPSINWLTSYSLYNDQLEKWYKENVGQEFVDARKDTMRLLQREAELKDIVQLVGEDALPGVERVILDVGRMIRESYLRQSAFDEIDAFTSMKKQNLMLNTILYFSKKAQDAVNSGIESDRVTAMKVKGEIARLKEFKESDFEPAVKKVRAQIDSEFSALYKQEKEEEEEAKEEESKPVEAQRPAEKEAKKDAQKETEKAPPKKGRGRK